MKRRILLFDTDMELCNSIQDAMQNGQTEVISTMSEMNVIHILAQSDCHVVIMGFFLSTEETLKIVHHIRSITTVPILMLAKNVENSSKIRLFHEGITAYLEKPFDMDVCAAQIDSLIQLYAEAKSESREDRPLVFGTELKIDPMYRQVIIDGSPMELTRTEFDLLVCLAQHPRQVWGYNQLYHHVWNDTLGLEGTHTVRTHIGNLKKKLADWGKDYIQNSRGVGYKFVPPL